MTNKINICLDTEDTCESFENYEKAIEYLKKKDIESKKIKVGDFVKVVDTGYCYDNLSKDSLEDLYYTLNYSTPKSLEIIFNINKDCLGYLNGIKQRKELFEVIAIFENGNKMLLKPTDIIMYSGYYIIGKGGVEKCEI